MYASLTTLNFGAFFALFVTGFVFIFKPNAAVLGYILLFITNTAFLFFIAASLIPGISKQHYFPAVLARSTVLVSTIFHFVSLVFIMIMMYKLHLNYTVTNGVQINIAEPYRTQLYNFNVLAITTFCICALLLAFLFVGADQLEVNFYFLLKHASLFSLRRHYLIVLTILLSVVALIISSVQVYITNGLDKAARQQLNGNEISIANAVKVPLSSFGPRGSGCPQ
jgi:hypothetical protein